MKLLPRFIDIDYKKYPPDIPEEELEVYYGLPGKVEFCSTCVMSNQRPNSCFEFEHAINSHKKTMEIQEVFVMRAMQISIKKITILTGKSVNKN